MHAIDPVSGKSYVNRAIEVAEKMMENKLIHSPSDRVGECAPASLALSIHD